MGVLDGLANVGRWGKGEGEGVPNVTWRVWYSENVVNLP